MTAARLSGRPEDGRKPADEALRASEERFRMLVQFSFDVYWETDEQHRFTRQDANGLADAPAPGSEIGKTRWEIPYLEPDEEAWREHRATLDAHLPFRDFELARPTPEGGKRYVSVSGIPVFDQTGRFLGYRGVGRNITERKRADEERRAHVWFLESLDRINRAIQGTDELTAMMSVVLEAVLEIFGCDRAWLLYPCDPEAPSWRAVMEHTRPQFPGAFALQAELPVDAEVAAVFAAARASSGALRFGCGGERELPAAAAERFAIRSQMAMAVHPKGDRAYLLGLHQCSGARLWTRDEQRLFEEVGHRLSDALTSLLVLRDLRESERRLEAAQRLAQVGWWEREYLTSHVLLSDQARRIFGVEPLDLPQWHGRWIDLIHPEDRARVAAASDAALRGSPRYDVEYRVVRADGAVRVVHSQGDVTWDEAGRPVRQFGVMQDITELRLAEDELRASEARFRTFVDHASDAFFLHQGERLNVIDVNRQACESLGYSRDELIGKHPRDFDANLDAASLARLATQVAASETVSFETLHRRKDGSVFPVEVRVRQFQQGERRFHLSLARDITERKRAEEEHRQHLWFLETMDRVNRAIQGTNDAEKMMDEVLDVALSIFNGDRALLVALYGEPETTAFSVVAQRDRLGAAGKYKPGVEYPADADISAMAKELRAAAGPVLFARGSATALQERMLERHGLQSVLWKPLFPQLGGRDRFYGCMLGQASYARVWKAEEVRLFREIARRLGDAVATLSTLHDLRQSEARLEEAQRVAHLGYWDRDLVAGGVVHSNESLRIFGIDPEERITDLAQWQARWQAFIHPEDRARVLAAVTAALAGGPRYDVEFRIIRRDGEVRVVHSQGDVIRDESGQACRMFGTQQDVTERKRIEEELRLRQEMLELAQKSAQAIAFEWRIGADGPDRNRWSPELAALYGVAPEAYDGSFEQWKKLIHPEDWPVVREAVKHAHRTGEISAEYRVVYPDGSVHWLHAKGRMFFDAQGQAVRMVGFMHDVTQRQGAEESLRRAEAELAHVARVTTMGELTASIAHEVNQPLGAMVANAAACIRWLAAKPAQTAKARRALESIAADGRRASEVIGRIRALMKRQAPRKGALDINDTILEVIALAQYELRRNDIVLETRLAKGLPLVQGDKVQLQQVLINLIVNAVEAMSTLKERPRALTIVSSAGGVAEVLVEVRDTGTGVDAERAERLFDAFYTTKAEGIGIGLSISRSILEAHGGRLWAEPNAPHGAVFRFSLPAGA